MCTPGGALYLSNVCEQQSVSDIFLSNSAQQGGAVAILNPALNSGRYILSVVNAVGTSSILRLPCGVNSALANATFVDNTAELSGGAVYAVSTPLVSSQLCMRQLMICNSLLCSSPCSTCALMVDLLNLLQLALPLLLLL